MPEVVTRASTRSGAFAALLALTTLGSDFLFVTGSFDGAVAALATALDKGFAFDTDAAGLVPAFAGTFTAFDLAGTAFLAGLAASFAGLTTVFAAALTAGFAAGLATALAAAFAGLATDFTAVLAAVFAAAGGDAAALVFAAGVWFFAGFFIAFAIESTYNRVALGYSVTAHG